MFVTTAGIIVETKELWEELQKSLQDFPVRVVFEQTQILEWASFAEKLQRLTPDVLFLDVSHTKDVGDLVRRIRALPEKPAVFVLNQAGDPGAIMEAIRAGASEYLYPPFGDAARSGLERLVAERQSRVETVRPGAKVLGFFSAKGGCGATTIAVHTALEFPHINKSKVLVADLDMDAGLMSFLLKTKSPYSLLDAAQNLNRLDASYWKALISNGIPGVEIITSPNGASAKQPVQPEQLEAVFYFVRTQYDWVVLDLGRGLSGLTLGCLEHCDQVFLITTTELPALHQAQQIVNRLNSSSLGTERLRILINRAPKRMELTTSELERMLGAPIFFEIPNDYNGLNDTLAEGKLVAPTSSLGRSYGSLARKIAGVEEKPKRRLSLFG